LADEIEQAKNGDADGSENYSTGDPELDAYLSGDSDDDESQSNEMDNIDDYGDLY
jgi:hypothetical protein